MKGVGKLDNTSNPNHSLSRPRLSRLRYCSNFSTYLFARDLAPGSLFFPGTGEENMVVDGSNHKPLALLCLAFGVVVQT